MNPTLIEKQEIRTLKQFYNLMVMTRDVRYKTVENLFKDQPIEQDSIASGHQSPPTASGYAFQTTP